MKQAPTSFLYTALVVIGGGALMGAMAIDTVAVLGRNTGIPLLGSIELVQLLIGIAGALSIVIATVHGSHAVVRIITSRLGSDAKQLLHCCNTIASAAFMLALTAGSVWLMLDLWDGREESELWGLPYRPLRLLISGAMLVTAALFVRAALRRHDQ